MDCSYIKILLGKRLYIRLENSSLFYCPKYVFYQTTIDKFKNKEKNIKNIKIDFTKIKSSSILKSKGGYL